MIQDDTREIVLASLCGLARSRERKGIDAHSIGGKPFELKSTTKEMVTTARDAGLEHLYRWRRQYWIIGKGPAPSRKEDWVPHELFFAHPFHLEPFFKSVEDKIKRIVGMFEAVILSCESRYPSADIAEMRKVVSSRVGTLNCPSIPMALIRNNCTAISLSAPSKHVERLVRKFPLA